MNRSNDRTVLERGGGDTALEGCCPLADNFVFRRHMPSEDGVAPVVRENTAPDPKTANRMCSTHPGLEVESPCIHVCKLDTGDVCVGCYRTRGEIARWLQMADAGKREVLSRLGARRADLAARSGRAGP